MILLVAEMEELKIDFKQPASGVIVESNLNSKRGNTATIIIKEGILTNKDIIGTDSTFGKIKIMEDFQGNPIQKADASTPIIITGFDKVPQVGEKFYTFDNIEDAKERLIKNQ